MTDFEDKLRRSLSAHLDPVEAQRSLPPVVRNRARRGRMIVIGGGVLGTVAVLAAAAIALPSLGGDADDGSPISNPSPSAGAASPSPVAITPHENGRIAYSVSGDSGLELHSMEPDGSKDRVIPTPPGQPWLHAWSPDGSRLAVSIFPMGPEERAIWVMNADGSEPQKIAAADNVSVPSWSPDGTTIAYAADTKDGSQIHLIGADGTDDRVIEVDETEGSIFSASFSPDGTKIMFDRGSDSAFDIFVMNVDGTEVRQLTDTGTDYNPQWSPDGTQIAFTRQEVASSDIFVMDADGSDVRRLTEGGDDQTNLYPEWAPDGTKIAYVAGITGGPGPLVVMNPDGSDPSQLVDDDVLGISWQPLSDSTTPDQRSADEYPLLAEDQTMKVFGPKTERWGWCPTSGEELTIAHLPDAERAVLLAAAEISGGLDTRNAEAVAELAAEHSGPPDFSAMIKGECGSRTVAATALVTLHLPKVNSASMGATTYFVSKEPRGWVIWSSW